jgi:DnaJ-class molecular chaperone
MLKFHPDKESSSLSKDMTLKIVEAYNTLRDIEKRKQYDLKMK